MEVKIFKRFNNKCNKSVYGVIGAKKPKEAIEAVVRFRKLPLSAVKDFKATNGVIAPYIDDNGREWVGLYTHGKGEKCYIVSKQ